MACVRKSRNRWVIDFYDQHGNRKRKMMRKGTTKKAARDELRAIEEMVDKGTYMPVKKIPVFSDVAKEWIEYNRPNVRETTWEVLEGHLRNHFDSLNPMKVNRISTATIEKFIRDRQDEGMNISTLRKILVTLGQILNYAVRHKYIDHNPLRDAERPRGQGKESQNKAKILTPEQTNALLTQVESPKYHMLFTLAVFSGARQGELLGLKWSDVDWKNRQIHIQRTFNKGQFFDVKTEARNRKIDIGPKVMTELKKWRLACQKNEFDLVFPNSAGKPMNYSNMMNPHFKPALEAVKLPRIRFHDLRHIYASLLIEQGENIKYIQTQLGHSSPMVTLTIYAHLIKPTNQQAARNLEKKIFGHKMVTKKKRAKRDEA